jgi:hypothetical protein
MQEKTGCQSYFSYRASIKRQLGPKWQKGTAGGSIPQLKMVDIEYYENNNTTTLADSVPNFHPFSRPKQAAVCIMYRRLSTVTPGKGRAIFIWASLYC